MAEAFEFLSPTDKPALLAIQTPEWVAMATAALTELGYKVHAAESHASFATRYAQVPYRVAIIEQAFGGTVEDNSTLRAIQQMPMPQRRHTTFFLLGDTFESLHALQAYQQSVHAVVNYSEMALLSQLIQKVVGENDLFLNPYREAQQRLAQGR